MAEVRSLLDDWRLRREHLLAAQLHDGLTAVLLKVFDFLIKRYEGTPEGNQSARYPLRSGVRIDERAIVVLHHLGKGEVAAIKTRAEAHAKSRRIMNRIALIDAQRDLKVPAGGRIDLAHAMPWKAMRDFLFALLLLLCLAAFSDVWPQAGLPLIMVYLLVVLFLLIKVAIKHARTSRDFLETPVVRLRKAAARTHPGPIRAILVTAAVVGSFATWWLTEYFSLGASLAFGFGWSIITSLSVYQAVARHRKMQFLNGPADWIPDDRRTMLSDKNAEKRIGAARYLANHGTLDDIGLLSDLLALPQQSDEDPRERPELVAAIEAISERHR